MRDSGIERLAVDLRGDPGACQRYEILIGSGLLERIPELIDAADRTKICVLCDRHVSRWAKAVSASLPGSSLVEVEPGEESKSPGQLERLWVRFRELGLDRRSLVVNIGGGMICDLGGMAAATYMRGLPFVQVPTSLLAQVDASIGGKVGINAGGVKNLVGAFAQPRGVIIDTATLTSLPERELASGFAEIVKHAAIADRVYLDEAVASRKLSPDNPRLRRVIARSCEIKRDIVQIDEKELGPRKLLNFGHTIGHAVESISLRSSDPLLHGEAVSIGMVAEARLSVLCGLMNEADMRALEEALRGMSLPVEFSAPSSAEDILTLISADKKSVGGRARWTLLEGLGKAIFDYQAEESAVREAIGYVTAR